jgi:hypothetical protein
VYVSGAAWSQSFKQYLRDHYAASSADYGWAIYGGGTPHRQSDILPWVNLDRISVRFSTAVRAAPDDLRVRGVNVPGYEPVSVRVDLTNGGSGSVATWTLSRPLTVDRLVVEVEGDEKGVTNEFGSLLDLNEDGVPGGDFSRRLNVVPGDMYPDGVILPVESAIVRTLLGRSLLEPGSGSTSYSSWDDVDGSGRINIRDLVAVRSRVYTYLPHGEPAASTLTASPTRTRAANRGIFCDAPILA